MRPNAVVQHVQLLRTPRVPQGTLGQLLRTRITRSPRTLLRRLPGYLGTLARLRPQRLDRRLHCSPPHGPDPPHSNHPPIVPGIGSVNLMSYPYLLGGNLKFYDFCSEDGLNYGGLAVQGYVPHASGRLNTAPLG